MLPGMRQREDVMEEMQEAVVQKQGGTRLKKSGKKPLMITCVVLAVLVGLAAGGYLGLCAWDVNQTSFYPNWAIY